MRIQITFSSHESGAIDFNYQHQIQAIIYGFLANSDPDYAQWLHNQGFVYKKDKRFKLFVFSGITFNGPIKTRANRPSSSNGINGPNGVNGLNASAGLNRCNNRNGFSFNGSKNSPFTFTLRIASPVDKFIQHLVDGIFREGNEITLGRQKATIYRVETLPDPISFHSEIQNPKSEILLKPLESPIFIKKPMPSLQHDVYLFPGDAGYEELLNRNLMHKYETLYGRPYKGEPLKFTFHPAKGKQVKHFTVFKRELDGRAEPINIKGTLQPFTVTGERELIWIGLECGFGQNNSMGCGYVEINRNGQDRQDVWLATNEHK